jgi:hypothetical protein
MDGFADHLKVRFDRVMDDATPGLSAAPRAAVTYGAVGVDVFDRAYEAEYEGTEINGTDSPPWASPEERLDFALIRLREAPGVERGWYELFPDLWPKKDSSLYLLQFPGQFAMKITTGNFGELCDVENRRRVRHNANSEKGSSGGLCLGYDPETNTLKPKALHQGCVKLAAAAPGGRQRVLNQAIPLAKITPKVRDFTKRFDGVAPIARLSSAGDPALNGAPVFGRVEFQRYAAEAISGAARIIVVRPHPSAGGVRLVGRTFSEQILRSMLPSERHQIIAFAASDIPSDARALAQRILDAVETPGVARTPLPTRKDAGTTDTAWIADQLLRATFGPRLEAAARGRLIWIVVDDLDRVDLPDAGGRRFLDALYQGVAAVPSLRIVLIGLMNDLPSIDPALLRIDRLTSAPGVDEVRAWLRHRFGPGRAVDDDIVDGLAKIALSVGSDGVDQTAALANAVQRHLDRYLPAEKPMRDSEGP